MHEAIVAGGGPAGSATALLLARAGISVAIIEQMRFPRTKVCGEYLNAGTVRLLEALGLRDELAAAAAPVHGIRLFGSGVQTELRFRTPGWSLPRAILDDALLGAALRAGAQLIHARVEDVVVEGERVNAIARDAGGERISLGARVLVGADGARSAVARKSGLIGANTRALSRFAIGGHYAGFESLDGFVEMFVDGSSYFAINPFDRSRANVMVIVNEADLERRRADVDAFIAERAERLSGGKRSFASARLEGKRVAIGPLAHAARAYCSKHVLLAGDAARFLDPFTGQGVYLALRSAQFASNAILCVLYEGLDENLAWKRYERALAHEIHERERLSRAAAWLTRVPFLARRAASVVNHHPARAQALIDAVAGVGPVSAALRAGTLARLVA